MQSHLRNKRKEPAYPLSFPTPPLIGKFIIDGVASPEGYIRFLKTGKAAALPFHHFDWCGRGSLVVKEVMKEREAPGQTAFVVAWIAF